MDSNVFFINLPSCVYIPTVNNLTTFLSVKKRQCTKGAKGAKGTKCTKGAKGSNITYFPLRISVIQPINT